MAIENLTYRRIGPTALAITWGSSLTEPTYYIYIDGVLRGTQKAGVYTARVAEGGSIRFEVFDDPGDTPSDFAPDFAVLEWDAVAGATQYRVYRFDDPAWTLVATMPAVAGASVMRYETGRLADDTVCRFKVAGVTGAGEGSAREYQFRMVRRPDPPDVAVTYDAGSNDLTVGSGSASGEWVSLPLSGTWENVIGAQQYVPGKWNVTNNSFEYDAGVAAWVYDPGTAAIGYRFPLNPDIDSVEITVNKTGAGGNFSVGLYNLETEQIADDVTNVTTTGEQTVTLNGNGNPMNILSIIYNNPTPSPGDAFTVSAVRYRF